MVSHNFAGIVAEIQDGIHLNLKNWCSLYYYDFNHSILLVLTILLYLWKEL